MRKPCSPNCDAPPLTAASEAKCPEKPLANLEKPLANIEKPLANECERRVHPNCDTPTLTTAGEARGNERPTYLPTYLPPDQKRFSDFYENLQKFKLEWMNVRKFGKSAKNFFLLEKNPTSSFKIGGIFGKKMFRKSFET